MSIRVFIAFASVSPPVRRGVSTVSAPEVSIDQRARAILYRNASCTQIAGPPPPSPRTTYCDRNFALGIHSEVLLGCGTCGRSRRQRHQGSSTSKRNQPATACIVFLLRSSAFEKKLQNSLHRLLHRWGRLQNLTRGAHQRITFVNISPTKSHQHPGSLGVNQVVPVASLSKWDVNTGHAPNNDFDVRGTSKYGCVTHNRYSELPAEDVSTILSKIRQEIPRGGWRTFCVAFGPLSARWNFLNNELSTIRKSPFTWIPFRHSRPSSISLKTPGKGEGECSAGVALDMDTSRLVGRGLPWEFRNFRGGVLGFGPFYVRRFRTVLRSSDCAAN